MKAVRMVEDFDLKTGKAGAVGLMEVPKPTLSHDEEVLIKVAYSSICGSDPNILRGAFPDARAPRPMGHELSGTIEALGPKAVAKGFKVGDRVTGDFIFPCHSCEYCQSGMTQFCTNRYINGSGQAEYIVWREGQVFKIPDALSLKQAALSEPFNISFHAVEIADMKNGSSVAISGAGGIGLMLTAVAARCGASSITVFEPVKAKRDLALRLGADYVVDPVNENPVERAKEITRGFGFNVVLESSGNSNSAKIALEIAAKQAHIVYMSMYKTDFDLPLNLFTHCYHNEIRIQGMFWAQGSFKRSLSMLAKLDIEPIISKLYKLEDCVEAYDDQISGKYAKLMFEVAPEK
jgi:(R,R)-butanediol dehydrogenase/meso-butanediol dehydrogenase/diacetyl reductase/L-iditol 2-dehydrogenase